MSKETENKALVLAAFDAAFNQRDPGAAERYWSPDYLQHSAHIPQGRDGLFNLVKGLPQSMRYENNLVMAKDNLVMLHGRFSGTGLAANWIAADIVRLDQGLLVEHWDVIQDEATLASSKSGLPMFGASFPS